MARQELHRHVEISDNERTVAAAEVTSQGPGGTAPRAPRGQSTWPSASAARARSSFLLTAVGWTGMARPGSSASAVPSRMICVSHPRARMGHDGRLLQAGYEQMT